MASATVFPATLQKRVLVVDDEPDLVRTIGLRLKSAGYEVLTAADGMKATQVAIQHRPDAIVMDIGLPAGDGHTVAERLGDHPSTMCIPVIFLTARTSQEDVNIAKKNHAFAYLVKPYDPVELLQMVNAAIEGTAKETPISMAKPH